MDHLGCLQNADSLAPLATESEFVLQSSGMYCNVKNQKPAEKVTKRISELFPLPFLLLQSESKPLWDLSSLKFTELKMLFNLM
jgi:hypothetical protein